jgi:hypothetical protein
VYVCTCREGDEIATAFQNTHTYTDTYTHTNAIFHKNKNLIYLKVRKSKLNFPIQSPGTQKRGVKRIGPVGGHENLDIAARVKAVKLVDELKHGSLNFIVTASSIIETSTLRF